MSEQLALIEIPVEHHLTDRQQTVREALRRAGHDGLDADAAGAIWCAAKGLHGPDDRCAFDGKSGQGVMRELEAKGLAHYRRANRTRNIHGAWIATGTSQEPQASSAMLRPDQPIPF